MTPYYDDGTCVIYHGDCREVSWPDDVALVLTDPPYGIAHKTDYATRGRGVLARTHDFPTVHGDDAPFDPQALVALAPCILWGANYFSDSLPASGSWLVWDKRDREGVGVNDQADGEMAWSNITKGVRIFRHMWNGMWRASERGTAWHPTQKPAALMRWAIAKTGLTGGLVFDPYMGSGPVAVATRDAGFRYVGIEIEERYCEIAAKRLSQETLGLDVPA